MRLDGRRESTNVEDRRGATGKAAGLGIGGILVVALITFLMGGNLGDVVQNVVQSGGVQLGQTVSNYESTPENEALAKFSRQILASTEDVWTRYFADNGLGAYKAPTLRNIAVSSPYMHDGRFTTLDEVIDFYSEGVKDSENINPLMHHVMDGGVQLTDLEKAQLKAFLNTLTDDTFLNNPDHSKP